MTTLADLIHQNYSKNPEKAAIILQHPGQDDKPVSYHDLVTGSARYARTYAEAGLQPGEVIILILQHGKDLVYSFWGAILHGAIPAIMPFLTEKLSPERYRADLAALLSVTQPTAIVTYPEFESDIRSAMTADSSVRTVLLTSQLAPEIRVICEIGRRIAVGEVHAVARHGDLRHQAAALDREVERVLVTVIIDEAHRRTPQPGGDGH